jgi:hypothetical protein
MKNLILLGLILILSSCRDYRNKPDVPMKAEDYAEDEVKDEPIKSTVTIHYEDGGSKTVNVNKSQSEKPNTFQNSYSTKDIQYSEEWRIRAFKVTKEFLIEQFPIDNKGCNITGFGYYKPHYVKYIGNNQFQLRMIINFKCNNNKDYTHRKRLTMVTSYHQKQNVFGFAMLGDKYLD